MKTLKHYLESYSKFLVFNWNLIDALSRQDQTGSFQVDWLQANWELLVEGQLGNGNIILEVYGEGADCNPNSSRVLFPDRLPTHQINCLPLNGHVVRDILNKEDCDVGMGKVIFDRFVTLKDDGWFYEVPKFEQILAEQDGKQIVLEFEELNFELSEIAHQ